jgi:hypothetical protein
MVVNVPVAPDPPLGVVLEGTVSGGHTVAQPPEQALIPLESALNV